MKVPIIPLLLPFCLSSHVEAKLLPSYSHIAGQAVSGVVNIRSERYIRRDPHLDLYQFFLGGRVPQDHSSASVGSGVIIESSGYIVTNYHVIQDARKVEVLFAKKKQKVPAKIVGIDRKTDLALLKIKPSFPLSQLSLGNSAKVDVGDIVLAVGNPFGYSHTVTSGIISARGRVLGTGPYDDFLQTDAPIHPGNSGGPLVDVRGRVIGINTAVSSLGHGIGFAIPSNMVKKVVSDLKKYGKVRRPWLGIAGRNILSREDIQYSDNIGVYGVLIANLIIDGPAHAAGLEIGDLIMKLGKKKVHDLNELQRILMTYKSTQMVSVKLYRRGRGFLLRDLTLEETPASRELPSDEDLF